MKSRIIVVLIGLILIAAGARAQTGNKLVIPDITAGCGSTVSLPVVMENTKEVVAVQFTLEVPDGVTLYPQQIAKNERLEKHTVSVREVSHGKYTFIILSADNEPIPGYAGQLFTIATWIGPQLYDGRTYPMTISEAAMSLRTGENVLEETTAGTVRVARSTDFIVEDVTVDQKSAKPGDQITVTWSVSNRGELDATGEWHEQLLFVSYDGIEKRLVGTAYNEGTLLQAGATVQRSATIALSQLLGINGDVRVRVKLVANGGSGERTEAQGNNTADSQELLSISKRLVLQMPPQVSENSQTVQCMLKRSGSWKNEESYSLSFDGKGRISAPSTITIPARQSGAVFYLTVTDNDVLDNDSVVSFTVDGNGYPAVEANLVIVDDEQPDLALKASKTEVKEGHTLTLTITAGRAPSSPLTVMLTPEHPQRFSCPRQVIIPAGETTATVEVTAVNDDVPSEELSTSFVASAAGYNKGEVIALLQDDDMPVLQLTLTPNKVQEGAGPVSVSGTLRRTGVTSNKITVRLTDDSNGNLYFGNREIVLNKGVEEASFNFGPIDNTLVDGDRTYTVTAAVWLSSCSCSAAGESAGSVSAQLQVLDNDGPALALTSTMSTIKEGGKTTLNVSRNTLASLDRPLTVTLSSDYEENLFYQHVVTIPAGEISVQVEVTASTNDQSDDTHTVVFTAQSEGYATGTCWLMVTDQTLPDAVITAINVAETEIKAGDGTQVKITVANYGQDPLPKGTSVQLYAYGIDNSIGKFATAESLEPGANTTLAVIAAMPDMPGRCYLYAVVNEEHAIQELNYGNNNSTYMAIQLLSRLTTTISTSKKVYRQGETVAISGMATGVAEGTEVEIYAVCDGIRYAITVTTDAQGRFDTTWQPSEGLMGHTLIGACHPGEGVKTGQTTVEIIGLKRATTGYTTCQTWVDEAYSCTIELQNPDSLAQTFSSIDVVQKPSYCTVDVRQPAIIEAGGTVSVEFTLLSKASTEGNDWENIVVRAMTYEGASIDLTLYYYCRPTQGRLVASESQISTTVTMGTTRIYPVVITNQGKGSTGRISLSLPNVDWLTAATPTVMSPLEYGDSATIMLRFTATTDMALNVPSTGTIGVNCENGNGLAITYSMEPVSDLTGTLTVNVTDEYTYYLDKAPGVVDATVTVRHPTTGTIVAQGISSNDGLFTTELPEGYYRIDVEAQKHSSYTNYVLVNPGRELQHEAFISYQAITYSMTVEETEVEDQYEVNIKADYETNVPKPVIVISLPEEEPMPGVPFPVVVTNKGLIELNHVNIQAVISSEYSFELLGNTTLDVLGPQQSHMLYAVIRDTTTPPDAPSVTPDGGGSGNWTQDLPNIGDDYYYSWVMNRWRNKCIIAYLVVEGRYICGPDWKWHFIPLYEHAYLFDCVKGKPGPDGGGQQPPNVGWNPPGGGKVGVGVVLGSVPVTTYECNPCLDMDWEPVADCIFSLGANLIPYVGGLGSVISDCTTYKTDSITGKTHFSYSSHPYCARGILSAAISFASSKLGFALGVGICLYDIWDIIKCFRSKPKNQARNFLKSTSSDVEWLYNCHELMATEVQATHDFLLEYFGNEQWMDCNAEEIDALLAYIESEPERLTFTLNELRHLKPTDISEDLFSLFIERVNNTNRYEQGLAEAASNMANASTLYTQWNLMKNCEDRAKAMGYANTADLYSAALPPTEQLLTSSTSHVCASVRFEIKQTMTLTRPAYRATLEVFNGHDETAMQNVRLNLKIKTYDGAIATDREFQVNAESLAGFEGELGLDGGWALDAQQTGTATILLIPTKYAAPTESKNYTLSGTLSYLDPFSGVEVSRPLLPQQLVVNPLPDLELTYLMQRDVYGDDPLTEDVVEPINSAELALIINNKGNGDAKNVGIVTDQPRIVDNEKGLLIELCIDSTQVNGQPANLSLGQTIANDFGTIGAQSQAYAQWWLNSTLLGHFTSYEVEATHVTSYGNANLSLVDTVTIHEMIHGFTPMVNGQSSKRGWLVNDIVDADDMPDVVYFADATMQPLNIANGASVLRNSQTEYLLTVKPRQAGWNYGSLVDPTHGRQKLVKIVRQSDGSELPVDNVWQTDRTLRDGHDWLYENRLHFVADLTANEETFILTFELRPDLELAIDYFLGVPDETTLLEKPLTELSVVFNKAILNDSFTTDDLTLYCQGTKLDASVIGISPIDATAYKLELGPATQQDGYYVLTVQTATITDCEGFNGRKGGKVAWVQYLGQELGQEDIAHDNTIRLFPLPMSDWLYVSGNFGKIQQVEVYDMRGMKRLHKTDLLPGQGIYTGGLSAGLYYVIVATDKGVYRAKVLKR